MTTITFSKNGVVIRRRELTAEEEIVLTKLGRRIAPRSRVDQLTTAQVAAAKIEERRRRQEVGGCCREEASVAERDASHRAAVGNDVVAQDAKTAGDRLA